MKIVAVNVSFTDDFQQIYTYLAYEDWLRNVPKITGTELVVPVRNGEMKIVYLHSITPKEDAKLKPSIDYKFIYGIVPREWVERYQLAQHNLN